MDTVYKKVDMAKPQETLFSGAIFLLSKKHPPTLPPLDGGCCEKIEKFPLTLPSPARGEGKHIEKS
jgi:hypothetical protein